MSDIKDIPIQELGSENSGENCAANEPFALRILDSSMSPEFEVDHIIIIDPSITPKSGDFVVYETRSSIIIREIMISDKMILKAYDKNLKDIEIQDTSSIIGVITQRSGTRRKYHKRYH